ncbi:fumarylacetoacetate hydrolase family protein [Ramlibacter sp.]|uniref:fumarylacetoacetate hydrolase family protein n=1 Tax=Ramlibacter sp. TaxID=1917967 RepID=UPI003D1318B7
MRLASFETAQGRRGFGAVQNNGAIAALDTPEVPTLRDALATWGESGLRERAAGAKATIEPGQFKWLPPILQPDKILCVGLNYRRHAEEAGMAIPKHPSMFVRFPGAQVGHETPTVAPSASEQYDYEAELAVIVGRGGRHLRESEAMSAIAGYACFAENSVRDFQKHAAQATPGKNFEASGAFGPWMTTADEVADPTRLQVIGRLNGEVMQDEPVSNLIFSIAQIVAYASSFARLLPGDVIVTGTPAGVGVARKPPRWLKPGDVFEVDIPGVGLLRNPVVAEAESPR